MAIELVEKYLPYVDEQFTQESKKEYLTNQDFSFSGAHSVKIYKISTGKMNDYGRTGAHWGELGTLWGGRGAERDDRTKRAVPRPFFYLCD